MIPMRGSRPGPADPSNHQERHTTGADPVGCRWTGDVKFSTDRELEPKVRDAGRPIRIRRTRLSGSAPRSLRSKPWTGPRRSCRCFRLYPRSGLSVTSGVSPTLLYATLEVATGKVTKCAARGIVRRSSRDYSSRSPWPIPACNALCRPRDGIPRSSSHQIEAAIRRPRAPQSLLGGVHPSHPSLRAPHRAPPKRRRGHPHQQQTPPMMRHARRRTRVIDARPSPHQASTRS